MTFTRVDLLRAPSDAGPVDHSKGSPGRQRAWKLIGFALFGAALLGSAAIGAVAWRIQNAVQENCRVAQQAHPHPGDDVAALIDFLNSASHSLWDRNHVAVWTLGRLRASEALPVLESFYTGGACEHDRSLCQYELMKAVKRCGGVPSASGETKG